MKLTTSSYRKVWTNPIHFLAFGLGSGTLPIAPGTWGTIAAIPIYLLLRDLSLFYYGMVLLVVIGAGIWLCDVAERDIGIPDYSGIVWDEIAGFLITMFAAPKQWVWILVGFILFRLFDIWKPWPIQQIDSYLKGGLGVMLDDVLAGIYAWLVLQILCHWIIF
jgi:phosphatidylglycerophosphatase A